MAEVVAEADRLGEVLVEGERAGDGAGDLRDLERMGHARAVVVALGRDEHLRLVLQAPEGLAVHDPVAIALQRRAQRAVGLGDGPRGRIGARGERRQVLVLPRTAACREALRDGARCGGGVHASILAAASPGTASGRGWRTATRGRRGRTMADSPPSARPSDRAAATVPSPARRARSASSPPPPSIRTSSSCASRTRSRRCARGSSSSGCSRWRRSCIALYALVDRRRGRRARRPSRTGLASDERVSQLENRIDRISRQVQDLRSDAGSSDTAEIGDRIEALERRVESLPSGEIRRRRHAGRRAALRARRRAGRRTSRSSRARSGAVAVVPCASCSP